MPQQMSLIGFDNETTASGFSISSFDFGVTGIVHSSIGYVLSPQAFDTPPMSDTECEELVFERSTTGRAARQRIPCRDIGVLNNFRFVE
jgi:hypothetical protein